MYEKYLEKIKKSYIYSLKINMSKNVENFFLTFFILGDYNKYIVLILNCRIPTIQFPK